MPQHSFPQKPQFLGDKRITPRGSKIHPQNFSMGYGVVWGSKNKKGGVGLFTFY